MPRKPKSPYGKARTVGWSIPEQLINWIEEKGKIEHCSSSQVITNLITKEKELLDD